MLKPELIYYLSTKQFHDTTTEKARPGTITSNLNVLSIHHHPPSLIRRFIFSLIHPQHLPIDLAASADHHDDVQLLSLPPFSRHSTLQNRIQDPLRQIDRRQGSPASHLDHELMVPVELPTRRGRDGVVNDHRRQVRRALASGVDGVRLSVLNGCS